jgi:hypothetical protein
MAAPAAGLGAALALFALLAGLHLRAPGLDSDQAVTGLMGVYILRGDFPVVFWGQYHAGVPESYGAAVTFHLLGISRAALSLVPILVTLGLLLLVYRTGRVLFGPGPGALAALFTAVVPPYVFAHYVSARSYYAEHLLLGQAVLLGAALWLARGPALAPGARARSLIAVGLAGGLGLYCGFQIVDALLPALAAFLFVDPRLPLRREAWLGAGAFGLGSLPFWIYNATHDWATFAVGLRYQGQQSLGEAARTILWVRLPVLLGLTDPAYDALPLLRPLALVGPLVLGGAVAWSLARVARGARRLREDHALAGEALLLLALLTTLGLVWFGRYTRVPRYLVPLAPVLALLLARAAQCAGRRAPVLTALGAGLYLVAVGVPLVRSFPALWPEARAAYRAQREADAALFAFLRAQGLTRAYAFDYWLAPRLTFDARAEIIVAEAGQDRYPRHAAAVDASPRLAYVVREGEDATVLAWLAGAGVQARASRIGPYAVLHAFTPPPTGAPLARAGWTVRAGEGRGDPAAVLDGRLGTGWMGAAPSPTAGPAWLEVDLGAPRPLSGLVLLSADTRGIPERLEVVVEGSGTRQAAAVTTGGLTVAWLNGAPRIRPGRALTVRFAPVTARRVRLIAPASRGPWTVDELFLLAPPGAQPTAPVPAALLEEGARLETAGQGEAALLRYHTAMRQAPDAPGGYEAFARLADALWPPERPAAERAARLAALGLREEARIAYERIGEALGSDVTHAELVEARARLARLAGDLEAAARLEADAAAARTPARPVGVVLGGVVELLGYDVGPLPGRPGGAVEVTTHWRLLRQPARPLWAWWHFRGEHGVARFGDDYPIPRPLGGFDGGPEHVRLRRRVRVPTGTAPGPYRMVVGVWDPATGARLHARWGGLLPTLTTALRVGAIEVRGPE